MLRKATDDANANVAMICFARKQTYSPPDPTVTASGQRIVFATMSETIGDVVISDTPQDMMEGLARVMRVLERVSCCHNGQKMAIDYMAMEILDCYMLSFSLRFLLKENMKSPLVTSFLTSFVSSFSFFSGAVSAPRARLWRGASTTTTDTRPLGATCTSSARSNCASVAAALVSGAARLATTLAACSLCTSHTQT